MEKQIVTETLNYELELGSMELIDSVIEKLNLAKKDVGATHIGFVVSFDSIDISFFKEREETDEEFNQRVAREKRNNDLIVSKELQELARLKAKYEK